MAAGEGIEAGAGARTGAGDAAGGASADIARAINGDVAAAPAAEPSAGLTRASMVPHFLQNLALGSFAWPHAWQTNLSPNAALAAPAAEAGAGVGAGAGGGGDGRETGAAAGGVTAGGVAASRRLPHFLQNFAVRLFSVAHWGQTFTITTLLHIAFP